MDDTKLGFFELESNHRARVVLEQISDGFFSLQVGFRYVARAGKEYRVEPKDLRVTDLTSVPVFLQFFAGRHGRHTLAALLHDHELEVAIKARNWPGCADADDLFREALHSLGVQPWRVGLMWAAVHLRSRAINGPLWVRVAAWGWGLAALLGTLMFFTGVVSYWVCRYVRWMGGSFSPFEWLEVGFWISLMLPFPFLFTWLIGAGRRPLLRLRCGVIASFGINYLLPVATLNLLSMGSQWCLDHLCRGRAPYAWPKSLPLE